MGYDKVATRPEMAGKFAFPKQRGFTVEGENMPRLIDCRVLRANATQAMRRAIVQASELVLTTCGSLMCAENSSTLCGNQEHVRITSSAGGLFGIKFMQIWSLLKVKISSN